MVRGLLEKHFPPAGDVFTVVFTVPLELKNDQDKLKEWLTQRSVAVAKKMTGD
jgi:hypothetical protein